MNISQKIRIYPNNEQKDFFKMSFGYQRYCYNKGLELWKKMYDKYNISNDKKDRPTQYNITKLLRETREEWEYNMLNNILESSCINLSEAFHKFWNKQNEKPKFHKKKNNQSFNLFRKDYKNLRIVNINNLPDINGKYLKINKCSPIKMSECIRYKEGIIKRVTISQKGNKYYASIIFDLEDKYLKKYYNRKNKNKMNKICGVDLGVKTLATINDNDNNIYKSHSIIKSKLLPIQLKIDYYTKILSRKQKGSHNYEKTRTKLNRLYDRKNNIINDKCHKLTTKLVKRYGIICIEDLNVQGLIKNHNLSKSIANSCFGRIRMMLEYKCELYKSHLIIANRWFPSTQRCSECGNILSKDDKIKLSNRTYKCPKCNNIIDRDINASINLKLYGMSEMGMAKPLI